MLGLFPVALFADAIIDAVLLSYITQWWQGVARIMAFRKFIFEETCAQKLRPECKTAAIFTFHTDIRWG